jgi:hypothetical protein
MDMALDGQKVMRAAGAATVAAPYVRHVRRLTRDDQLRDDVKTVMDTAKHLYDEVSEEGVGSLVGDDEIRREIDVLIEALLDAGEHLVHPRHRTSAWVPVLIIGGTAAVAVGAVLAYPPSRDALMRLIPISREQEAPTADAQTEVAQPDVAQAA